MTRKRFIDPNFWTDIAISKLTPIERLLFIGCFSNADDEGRLPGNPAYLRSAIFPYDDISLDEIREMRDRIVHTCKNLVLFEVDENEFLAFTKWSRYQSPRYPKPSQFPAPPLQHEESNPAKSDDDSLPQPCNQKDASLQPNYVKAEAMGSGSGWDQDQYQDQDGVRGSTQDEVDPLLPSDATSQERLVLHELKHVERYPLEIPRDLEHIRTIAVDFPTIDILAESKRWRAYKLDKPLKDKSNARLQFRNWCEKSVQWSREESKNGSAGRYPSQAGKTAADGDARTSGKDYRGGRYGSFFKQSRAEAAEQNSK